MGVSARQGIFIARPLRVASSEAKASRYISRDSYKDIVCSKRMLHDILTMLRSFVIINENDFQLELEFRYGEKGNYSTKAAGL